MKRAFNFGPGPSALPLSVLQETAAEWLDFAGTGMSVLEVSHRGAEYEAVHKDAQVRLKRLLGLGDDYTVLMVGGGASTQFAAVPLNLLRPGQTADYLVTGYWAKKAYKEAQLFGTVNLAADTAVEGAYCRVPRAEECLFTPGAAYVHLTSNNTIFGSQYPSFPKPAAPLVADMSSDLLSRPIDARAFGLIYAGAQKNLGPAGVTVVIIRNELLERCRDGMPTMLHYPTLAKADSLHNTPPCFAIYLMGKVFKWVEEQGGLEGMGRRSQQKAATLYGTIDRHPGFYRAPVDKDSRSAMNVVFRLPSEELEKRFISEAKAQGMIGLKGHRSVGGVRASIYNGVEPAWVEALASFMESFVRQHG